MLTKQEVIDANSHDRAIGQRPTGHFDHDASRHAGPAPHQVSGQHEQNQSAEQPEDAPLPNGKFGLLVPKVDKATGEKIFTIVPK